MERLQDFSGFLALVFKGPLFRVFGDFIRYSLFQELELKRLDVLVVMMGDQLFNLFKHV